VLAVCAWLRRDGPLREDEQTLVNAVAKAMLSEEQRSLAENTECLKRRPPDVPVERIAASVLRSV
jgi:hypothetical protein